MTHEKTSATSQSSAMARLAHLGRVSVFFLTAGFAYPNVMVEGLDLTRIQGDTEGDLYKKK
jgi:hypothetical protein